MSASEILEQIRRLPLEEQYDIAEKVWAGLGDVEAELPAEQAAELDRRLADFEKDPRAGIPLEKVKAEMRQRFGWE
jgi:putative addiction module component (TIGR02574 family)